MAEARLTADRVLEDGRTAYRVDANPWNAPPFAGPSTRDWDDFRVLNTDEAIYQWRTGADALAENAAAAIQHGWSDETISRLFKREFCLQNLLEAGWGGLDEGEGEPPTDEEQCRNILAAIADGTIDLTEYDSGSSYYNFESDEHLADAADALELPEWAKRRSWDDGGPGSGYTAQFIVLAKDKTLADLAEWLEQRKRPTKKRRRRATSS